MPTMFKYNNSGMFVNSFVKYPFNITNMNGIFVENFWTEIDKLIKEINNEKANSKIRYIWIDAGCYCQTEIFLKDILSQNHGEYPVLYLHWIDFVNKDISIYNQLSNEKIGDIYFTNNTEEIKICVIDHAEAIAQKDQYLELCKKLHNDKYLFIFVNKRDTPASEDWKEILKKASIESDDDDPYLGIKRSNKNYYMVKPYSQSQCKAIFQNAITKNDIKRRAIDIAETLGEELRRPYYFDYLLKELNAYENVSQMPAKFDDLTLEIFTKTLDGIVAHLIGHETLKSYLDEYYVSAFVKTFSYGEQSRIPLDNYVWARGIIHCSGKNKYENVVSAQFAYLNESVNINFGGQIQEINERIVSLYYSDSSKIICKNFVLKDYFLQMVKYSINSSTICASVLCKNFEKIDLETREVVFKALGKRYNDILESKDDIFAHYLLGMNIGLLLHKVSDNCIVEGLNYLFKYVSNDFVEPNCNTNGISVIPVTNFEFEKFAKNNGYALFYSMNSDKPLNEIATEYYRNIFDFIISALSGKNRRDSNCLARLLKGYGWNSYKQIAYLFSRKEDIDNDAIYTSIGVNYPDNIMYPAKWIDNKNTDTSRPFCNPLQPVVCVNIFEARAYVKWLSSKINKPVRLLNYDPDYLSVIGDREEGKLRESFISHIEKQRNFINSVENENLFYGKNDIRVKEPSPVAMPNTRFLDLYDFVGNIFEIQDTPFTYNYVKDIEDTTEELTEIQIDYNCPGGGLQRTEANWPPEYMGQVPAFLRNQDIGFRIVIGGSDIGLQKHKYRALAHTDYSENIVETFTCIDKDYSSILAHIHIDYASADNEFSKSFLQSKVFSKNTEKEAIVYTQKDLNSSDYKESILLVRNKYSIFAYHLVGIASIHTDKCCQKDELKMIIRKPKVPKDLATRKKMQNSSYSEWIDITELVYDNYVDIYIAYPVNIINGYFQIANRNVRYETKDGIEHKKKSTLSNTYYIQFNSNSQDFKTAYYDCFKEKLGADFFLPDWIDIVDFIRSIHINMSETNALDIETVMAAITTIDTADLHEQINKNMNTREQKNSE